MSFFFAIASVFAAAVPLQIVTTTTDLASIAEEIAGAQGKVASIAKGSQDPHYIEAKPSYMVKVNQADLVLSIGLELEVGWLPSIVTGARNPKINPGTPGFLEVGPLVDRLEVPKGEISRAEGDVHPAGNPHVTLDPIRAGLIAVGIADRLGKIDPAHAADYLGRAKAFQSRMVEKTKGWAARIKKSGIAKVVSYHKTLSYFFDRFGIQNPGILEPKPGLPPTSAHIIETIALIKKERVPLILIENFFDPTVADRIRQDVPSIRSTSVPVAVGGEPGILTLDDLYESLVKAVEGKPHA